MAPARVLSHGLGQNGMSSCGLSLPCGTLGGGKAPRGGATGCGPTAGRGSAAVIRSVIGVPALRVATPDVITLGAFQNVIRSAAPSRREHMPSGPCPAEIGCP
eukprot:CAMPEP_0177500500 /NCGR_PEP_ID=MMETSP0369-20130122/36705_1 /TAXON_ID=447022 ORGANISM="Scrippsiella hangoei-like, Strain SHHI-4" /NCGR_SAMPLE_ID=MMETSP0369 /ASSEMBLY_ACC=CAM_ASM_000364 /LENGTH=102 /DNA_ID=CAMNT_0018977905 /DNA_START=43 /DNA_END=348 /DNA_ORIENTATION=+